MNQLIKVEARVIGNEEINAINARELHEFLEVGKDFSTWIKSRIEQYDFSENDDYISLPRMGEQTRGGQNKIDYIISLDMAKELSMVEKNDKGKEARKYFASVLTEDHLSPEKPIAHFDNIVGIDLGIKDFLIDSDGTKIQNPGFTKRLEKNLKRKQRKLSRKKKTSNRRAKAKLLVAKAHEKTKNARTDFQHKLSKNMADKNQAVGVETLRVKNMLKNRKLAKAISDVAWSGFVTKLEYKLVKKGGRIIKLNTFFPSSKLCSACSCKMDKMPLSIREWQCPICGAFHDRDINAACNIRNQAILELKAAGCTVSARGGIHKTTPVAVACEAGSPVL